MKQLMKNVDKPKQLRTAESLWRGEKHDLTVSLQQCQQPKQFMERKFFCFHCKVVSNVQVIYVIESYGTTQVVVTSPLILRKHPGRMH